MTVLRWVVTAVLHHLAPRATVIGMDHLRGLVDMAEENLRKDGVKLGLTEGVEIICGDGRLGGSVNPLLIGFSAYSVADDRQDVLSMVGEYDHFYSSS